MSRTSSRPNAPSASPEGVGQTAILQMAGNMAVQRRATGRAGDDPPQPGPATRAALNRSGAGEQLSAADSAGMETAFSADFGRVRIHTDQTAGLAAEELEAGAFTVGQDVFFGRGQFRPGTAEGKRLLTHELTHTLQNTSVSSNARTFHVLPPDSPLERQAEVGAPAVDRREAACAPSLSTQAAVIMRQPLAPPPSSTVQLGAYLESDDPLARTSALQQLADRDDEAAWRALLLAQQSRNEDVRTEAQALIARKVAQNPDFETFLLNLANSPRGAISDLAVRALNAVQGGMLVDVDNYRKVIHQRLTLARDYLSQMDSQLQYISIAAGIPDLTDIPPAEYAINTLEINVDITPFADLPELGLQASTLLDQLGQIRAAVQQVLDLSNQHEEGAVGILIQKQLIQLLTQARQLTGMEDDSAFGEVLDSLSSWPGRFAAAVLEDLHKQFSDTRNELKDMMDRDPLPRFGQHVQWPRFRDEVMSPLLADVDTLIAEIEFLKPEAADNPDAVFGQLQGLQAPIKAIGERLLYTFQAGNVEELYRFIVVTGDPGADILERTKIGLIQLTGFFEDLAAIRDEDPEEARRRYDLMLNDPAFKTITQDVEEWNKIVEGEERFMHFLADILIVIASIYTGGLAGGFVRGLFGTALTFGGRVAVGALAFSADVAAFTLTNRGLRWAMYGENFTEGLGGDLAKNALMFGFLKGSAAVYERFAAPMLPKALRPTGAMTTTFVAFQAWSVGYTLYDTGEWIGMTNPRFWKMAAENAFTLGVIHLGMKITKPLVAPMQEAVLNFQVARHNARCASLEAMIQSWTGSERPAPREGVSILRRAQALYSERLDVLREINRVNPKELTAEELQQAVSVLQAQIQAVENTLIQSHFNLTAHETSPNTFYYEGDPVKFRETYERQGYEVIEEDQATKRMRLRSPDGQILDMIRTSETPQEIDTRTQHERAAEQRVAAAMNVADYLTALRQQPHRAGSPGVGWDHTRFRQAPRGRAGQWRVGDPIDMPDSRGNYPTFDTARQRYWKNRAHFELQGRARGEVRQDPNSLDPMRRLSNADLQAHVQSGSAPPDPRQPGRTMELEHSGVPQRVQDWLQELGFSAEQSRRLAEVSKPGALLEVRPVEHAFFDVFAQQFGSQRADIAGDTWSGTREADVRRTRPMEPMSDATIAQIVREAARRGYNFNRNAKTRALRAAIDAEIAARNITIYLP